MFKKLAKVGKSNQAYNYEKFMLFAENFQLHESKMKEISLRKLNITSKDVSKL